MTQATDRLLAFTITGTVQADSTNDALHAVAAYLNPDNHDHDDHEGQTEPICAFAVRWYDVGA